ncbi:hypothetical protein DASC09_033810 [Saccharomycopsis crataegensis]|uniref:C2H2-type domain-containing protein n=1 Tax=Saccharomycopsis crataegensis TaxID=43959 RepID=A0AAV5QMX7_9ASCO|nr:hypothetical protein DASC09_033810 [Saccharomycopsis crataegensis]
MHSEKPSTWERKCKTCNIKFTNERSCALHLQQYTDHQLESAEEVKDRVFRSLANNFTESLTKRGSSSSLPSTTAPTKRPSSSSKKSASSSRNSSVSSPGKKRKNIIFTNAATVPSSLYKDNRTKFTQDLVFISDDQESFEPIYGPDNPVKELPVPVASKRAYCSPSPCQSPNQPPVSSMGPETYYSMNQSRRKSSSSFRPPTSSSFSSTRPETGRSSISSMNQDDPLYPSFKSPFLPYQPSQTYPYPNQPINYAPQSQFPPSRSHSFSLPPRQASTSTASISSISSSSEIYPHQLYSRYSFPSGNQSQGQLESSKLIMPNANASTSNIGASYDGSNFRSPSSSSRRGSVSTGFSEEPITLPSIKQIFEDPDVLNDFHANKYNNHNGGTNPNDRTKRFSGPSFDNPRKK